MERAKRRTSDEVRRERLHLIDEKIARKKRELEELEIRRQELINPPISMTDVVAKLRKSGMTPEEIGQKLGLYM